MKKRFLSAILATLVCISMLPISVFAEDQLIGNEIASSDTVTLEEPIKKEEITEDQTKVTLPECHQEHDTDCGYVKQETQVACTHLLEDGTYSCKEADSPEDYICSHEDECGYKEEVEGSECTHSCELCETLPEINPLPLPEIVEGEITQIVTLSDEVLYQRTTLNDLKLPETITGIIDGEEVQIPVTWEGLEIAEELKMTGGLASFTPEIQEQYTLGEDVNLPTISAMIIGKGRIIGLGTEANPLEIATATQLNEISQLVGYGFKGENFGVLEYLVFGTPDLDQVVHMKLANDIDLSNTPWRPIGYEDNPFSEVFDGNGHSISGLNDRESYDMSGLFGYVESAVIKNVAVHTLPEGIGGEAAGIIAAVSEKDTIIQNCYTTGLVEGNYSGGIVGISGVESDNNTIITNCYSYATVMGTEAAGGITGIANAGTTIDTTFAAGKVDGEYISGVMPVEMSGNIPLKNAGGIVGKLLSEGTVKNSVSLHRNVIAVGTNNKAGRIAGVSQGNIENSYSIKQTIIYGTNANIDGNTLGAEDFVLAVNNNPWVTKMGFTTANWEFETLKLPKLKTTKGKVFENQNNTLPGYVKSGEWVGKGSQANPFKISSEEGLRELASQVDAGLTYEEQYFELTEDILLQGGDWNPIGASDKPFKGNFDGKDHTISGLTISTNNQAFQGLFAYVENGTVKNLKLENVEIDSATSQVGAIAGRFSGTMDNVHVEGEVRGSAYVGGLVGELNTTDKIVASSPTYTNSVIKNSSSKVYVKGTSYVGGLVGAAVPNVLKGTYKVSIDRSYSEDSVIVGNNQVGGLIGRLYGSRGVSTVTNSYSTANVNSGNRAGGLVGYINADEISVTLEDVYAIGDIESTTTSEAGYAGGLVGQIDCITKSNSDAFNPTVNINRAYTAGNVLANNTSGSLAGGIVGYTILTDNSGNESEPYVNISNSMAINKSLTGYGTYRIAAQVPAGGNDSIKYTNNRGLINMSGVNAGTTPALDSENGANVDIGSITGEMNQKLNAAASSTWDITDDQHLPQLKGVGQKPIRPEYLRNFSPSVDTEFKGDGTSGSPYLIQNLEEFEILAKKVNAGDSYAGKHFELTSDIEIKYDGWTPIGTSTNKFKGYFNGNNKTLSGLVTFGSSSDTTAKGLFGYVEDGTIKNLTVENAYVVVYGNNGALLAANIKNTIIENCHATGEVAGYNDNNGADSTIGGLIGFAESTSLGKIIYSTFNGEVKNVSEGNTGGLVGEAKDCNISYSSAEGFANGNGNTGGLVGLFVQDTRDSFISSSFASGYVYGTENAGGLVGEVESKTKLSIENSYANTNVSGESNIGGILGNSKATGNSVITVANCYTTGILESYANEVSIGGIVAMADEATTIKNCVALNEGIFCEGDFDWGRITPGDESTAQLENNYAYEGMRGIDGVFDDAEDIDGLSIIHDEFKVSTWWKNTAKFEDMTWTKADMKLPIINTNSLKQQNPDLPIYLTNFVVLVDSQIEGTLKYGQKLTAKIEGHNEKTDGDLSYQWYRFSGYDDEEWADIEPTREDNMLGLEKIEDATKIEYTTTVDDVDMYLYCEYKGKNHNYRDMAITKEMVIRADGPTDKLDVDFSLIGEDKNQLTNTLKEYEYSVDNGTTWTDCVDVKTDLTSSIANFTATEDILVRVKLTDTHFEGTSTRIDLVEGEKAENVETVSATSGRSDGKLVKVSYEMEYKAAEDSEWIAITGKEVSNLSQGSYEVRYKATKLSLPGAIYTYTVGIKGSVGGGGGGGGTVQVGSPEIKINGKTEKDSKLEILAGEKITLVGAQEGSKIYYTTDGSTPNRNSNEYKGPFEVEDGTTLKFIEIGSKNSAIKVVEITVVDKKVEVIPATEKQVRLSENASTTRYMEGLNLTEFGPDKPISRLRVLKSISNLLTFDLPKDVLPSNFVDVSDMDKELIGKLQASGIIVGKPDGTLGANDSLTRAEFAVIACNILGIAPEQGVAFTDTNGHWANGYLMALKNRGFIAGYEDGTGRPDSYLTAAEFVAMTNTIAGIDVNTLNENPSETVYNDVNGHWAQNAISAVIK